MAVKVSRALYWAAAVSLATHLVLLVSAGGLWFRPVAELDFPIEASLVAPEPEPAREEKLPKPAPRAAPVHSSSVPPPVPAAPPAATPQTDRPEAAAEPEQTQLAEPATPSATVPVAMLPAEQPSSIPERPARTAARELPEKLVIHYVVQTGDGEAGFVAGRATYLWQSRDGRYSLVSTVEATGLASLFISGRIVQLSEGRVGGDGLRPEQYWLQRKERRQETARFNWELGRLTLEGRGSHALTAGAQDLLSFPFHLAMTMREGEADFSLGVTNGRKFDEYRFHSLGREMLEMKGQRYEVLHVQGSKEGEGLLDVWLDMGQSGLPVRVRTLDRKGKVMELRLEGSRNAEGSGG